MNRNENRNTAASDDCPDAAISKIYFSCPKFTVLLAVKGRIIVKAAPNSRWTFHHQLVDSVGFPALHFLRSPAREQRIHSRVSP